MADVENLRTASLYINNQLLSRGLLRDGQTIDFADPGRGTGGTAATMGRIISVVNDLILRRDKDAENRESLSTTLRTLRAENLRQANDVTRLTEKQIDTQRKLDISLAAETSLQKQLKSAETAARVLKDEIAKARSLVAQTRTTCAADVRRRDRQIDVLKRQVTEAGRARGTAKSSSVTVINVTGGVGVEKSSPARSGTTSTESDAYDLRSETNEFLTQLAKGLSEDNEVLMSLLRHTRDALKNMSGWGQEVDDENGGSGNVATTPTMDRVESDLDSILDHLRVILTNPSFVPIEEVVVRENEIGRLRDGWVQMESRWREAVHLIDGWRKRMAASGRPVNMEELKMGLRLSPVRVRDVEETHTASEMRLEAVQEVQEEEEGAVEAVEIISKAARAVYLVSPSPAESLQLVPQPPPLEEPTSDSEPSVYDEDLNIEEYDLDEPNVQILQQSTAFMHPSTPMRNGAVDLIPEGASSPPLPPPPQMSPLKDSPSAGNRKAFGDARFEEKETGRENGRRMRGGSPTRNAGNSRPNPTRPPASTVPTASTALEQPEDLASSTSSLDSILLNRPHKSAEVSLKSSPKRIPIHSIPDKAPGKTSSNSQPGNQSDSTNSSQDAVGSSGAPSSPRRNVISSRLPLPRPTANAPPQSPLTMAAIAAKLAASEREADAARVRAKLKAARLNRAAGSSSKPSLAPPPPVHATQTQTRDPTEATNSVESDAPPQIQHEHEEVEHADPLKRDPDLAVPKRKRDKRASRVASRRRSTLNPWELEALIAGNSGVDGA